MKLERESPKFRRRDLTDKKPEVLKRLNDDIEQLTAKNKYDDDKAYLTYIKSEKKKLQSKDYLLTNIPSAPQLDQDDDNLVYPNIKKDKYPMINWSNLPPNAYASNGSYFDDPNDKYYQYLKNAKDNWYECNPYRFKQDQDFVEPYLRWVETTESNKSALPKTSEEIREECLVALEELKALKPLGQQFIED